jgi:hypothetical protein
MSWKRIFLGAFSARMKDKRLWFSTSFTTMNLKAKMLSFGHNFIEKRSGGGVKINKGSSNLLLV